MASGPKDSLVGKRIREYEILEELGRGGMGSVYRARHTYLAEDRAIKVVQTRLAGDKHFVESFIREARILTKLRHPHLVQLHEFGTLEEDTFFMVMEYIHGESVLERIERKGRISIRESLKISREAALGLHNAHFKGIVHRDISPDNLLLVKDVSGKEITKVIDFGVAKINLETTHRVTAATQFLGKPEYCSPEQCGALEETETIDRRSDIYSLGVTLYHMVSGQLPFHSSSPQGYILRHVNEIPKPPSTHVPGEIFPELDQMILKMLAKKREDRFSSMEELIREIDKINPFEAVTIVDNTNAGIATEFVPGDLFASRYKIESKLGEGGMGVVYKAIDKILEAPVALKVVNSTAIEEPKMLERFKREVILARRVAHPNVCRIYDIGESRGVHYVSMELLKGRTLSDMLEEHSPLQPEVGLSIIRQVLTALKEAHRVGVIHRDLKPKNIIVDQDLKAFITDFGISISRDSKRITDANVLVGTPQYMAPEQFESADVDQRADIYSIGIIMYEMFTGRLPFSIESPATIIFAHLKTTFARPSTVCPGIPEDLERMILKCLEKDVAMRYQAVRDLLYDLDRCYPSSSAQVEIQKEALANKLIAEKNYSRAIKYLNSLLRTDPGNSKMQKLLQGAVMEKARKDGRRVRSLVERRNLIQAQILVDRIKKLQPTNPRILAYVQKLEQQVEDKKKESVNTYIREAKECMENGDWDKGVVFLESAAHLDADDTQITQLAEQFLSAREQMPITDEATLRQRKLEFSEMLGHGMELFDQKRWDDAVRCFRLLVDRYPEYPEGMQYLKSAVGWAEGASEVRERLRNAVVEVERHMHNREWDKAIQFAEYTLETDYSAFINEDELRGIRKLLSLAIRERINSVVVNAVVKTRLMDLVSAEALYRQALGWDPTNSAARSGLDHVLNLKELNHPTVVAPVMPPSIAPPVTPVTIPKKKRSVIERTWWVWILFAIASGFLLRSGIDRWFEDSPAAARMTVVSINALPWARIKIIPADSNLRISQLSELQRYTPCNLLLPDGDYYLKLENDQVSISRKIAVRTGGNNTFDFEMPEFNVDFILAEIGESK